MDIATLYPRYWGEIVRYARSMVKDRAAAEDVAQEAFMRALKNSHVLMEMTEAKARAWLYTTARNIIIDQARRTAKGCELVTDDWFEDDFSAVEIASVLGVLSESDRRIAVMRYFEDQNSTEIGERLGMPSASVRTRLRAITKQLRALHDENI